MSGELLLELLSEEIPARMQRRAIADLKTHLDEWLQAHRIRGVEAIHGYVTPRRLTVIAYGIPERQPPRKEERRGPRVGSPQQAIDGFLRSAGIASIEQCEVRATDRGEFYFAVIERPGRAAADALPDLIYSTISDVAWPKSMRYPASRLRWVRPLNSVICLLDGAVLSLPLGDVPVGRMTQGHRFLSKGKISVDNAGDYLAKLEKAHVVLDPVKRRQTIADGLDRLAKAEGLTVKDDPQLLEEVTGLVEFPVVLAGSIDADFMMLPPEVLATAMRTHQRYFSCLQPDGRPARRFLFVADNLAADGGKLMVAGNERVLRARLADAHFFWDRDRRAPLESRVEALSQRVFHAKLGSLRDKVARMEGLADFLVQYVPGADAVRSRRAVQLAKADLSTGMVGEFPEVQGIMGRYYALHDGEHPAVANAIAEHYRPLGPNDACPTEPDSVVVALADKIDSLISFFAIGEKPTGSRDPFALRRAALGIIRLVLENKLRLSLGLSFTEAVHRLATQKVEILVGSLPYELTAFIADRLKVHLRAQGVRHDLIAAAFAQVGTSEDDLVRLLKRVDALGAFLASEDGANLLTAYRRASNIVAIEERKDGRSYDGEVDPALLRQSEEQELAERLAEVAERTGTFLQREEFEKAMSELARLRRPVDDFFDKVTVNTEDAMLRENRLRLLSRIRATLNRVADFSQIEG
ncbi:MAG TPA: glycine--tRNA ligase subunit beta [Stellaceae bacterium]